MSQWWLLWPRKCKIQHSVLAAFQLQFWLQPDNSSQVEKVITQTLVTPSLCWGCLTITAAVSSSVDAYVCRIWTNPATCVRSTVSLWCRSVLPRTINLFPLFEKPAKENGSKMRLRDTPVVRLKDCFFGRCSGAEFKMGEMRGRWCQSVIYCCSQWYYTLIHQYRLPFSVILYDTGCQPVCDFTHIATNSAIHDNIGC